MAKTALITGITGQDGSLLADFLLKKNYKVVGIKRRSSSFNTQRIDHLYKDNVIKPKNKFQLVYGDLTDSSNILRLIDSVRPNEIYNLGAQSHVHTSFQIPEFTANVDAFGSLRILEAIRVLKLQKKQDTTKHPPQKYLEIQRFLKMKNTIQTSKSLRCFKTLCLLDNCKL